MKKILILIIAILNLSTFMAFADGEVFLSAGQKFCDVTGLSSADAVISGVIVRNDGKCADIADEDLRKWLNVYWNFSQFDRVIAPYDKENYNKFYIKLITKDSSVIIYPNSGVIVGRYGGECESYGEVKKNYIWYLPYIGNARNALYSANTELERKYIVESAEEFVGILRDATPDDAEILPDENMLVINGASEWARTEIQNAAACNLLPYELTDKYRENITRIEFCDLIYRLIATEFAPYSDSRMGEWSAIDSLIYERQLTDRINSVSFSDCNDDKIRFLAGADIIKGMGDGTFVPEGCITREQAATILLRTAEFLGNKTILELEKEYSDEELISDWAKKSVEAMNAMGIMMGTSPTEFMPQGSYSVEQAIVTILRLYECK